MEKYMNDYEIFCEHMQRYENGERDLTKEEKEWQQHISQGGVVQSLPFELFIENMQRYENGERTLSSKDMRMKQTLISCGDYSPLSFEVFLENMLKYQEEKNVGMHK